VTPLVACTWAAAFVIDERNVSTLPWVLATNRITNWFASR